MHKLESRDDWIKLSGDRKMQHFKNFIVVVPENFTPGMPFACSTCGVIFSDQADIISYHQYGCCVECSYEGHCLKERVTKKLLKKQ